MPKFKITSKRTVMEIGVVVIEADTESDAWEMWEDREDDDAYGCTWTGGDVLDEDTLYIEDHEDAEPQAAEHQTVCTLIETVDVDVTNVQVFLSRAAAVAAFYKVAEENAANVVEPAEFGKNEPATLILFAGDDTYSVAVYEVPTSA